MVFLEGEISVLIGFIFEILCLFLHSAATAANWLSIFFIGFFELYHENAVISAEFYGEFNRELRLGTVFYFEDYLESVWEDIFCNEIWLLELLDKTVEGLESENYSDEPD